MEVPVVGKQLTRWGHDEISVDAEVQLENSSGCSKSMLEPGPKFTSSSPLHDMLADGF